MRTYENIWEYMKTLSCQWKEKIVHRETRKLWRSCCWNASIWALAQAPRNTSTFEYREGGHGCWAEERKNADAEEIADLAHNCAHHDFLTSSDSAGVSSQPAASSAILRSSESNLFANDPMHWPSPPNSGRLLQFEFALILPNQPTTWQLLTLPWGSTSGSNLQNSAEHPGKSDENAMHRLLAMMPNRCFCPQQVPKKIILYQTCLLIPNYGISGRLSN